MWPRAAKARPKEDRSTVSSVLAGKGWLADGAELAGLAVVAGKLGMLDEMMGLTLYLLFGLLPHVYRLMTGILEQALAE